MKKPLMFFIILLSILAMPVAPIAMSASPKPSLKFSVTPVHEQFVEAASGEPLPSVPGYYLPYDVDLVNGELFANGGEGIYIAVIDTGLVNGWQNFLPPTATVRTDLGKGWSYDVVWNPGINDFDWTPNEARDSSQIMLVQAMAHM